jgi:glutaredoxin
MGRITIFTLDDCPHCVRTKSEMKRRRIPYLEISLSQYPQKRNDMISITNRATVPQVFINEALVGGADDTIKLLEQWDRNSRGLTPREVYDCLVAAAPSPTDPRLHPSKDPPITDHLPPPRDIYSIRVPAEQIGGPENMKSVVQVTELLKAIVPRKDLSYNLTVYKNSFTGATLVTALSKHFSLPRFEAANFARTLQVSHELFHHVANDHIIQDTDDRFFRLHCDQTPHILNSYRIWNDRVDPNPMALLKRLKKQLDAVLKEHTNNAGKINYKGAVRHREYPVFEEAVCELQAVDYESMSHRLKLAFSINLYNMMIKYAFAKVGVASSAAARHAFFSNVAIQLGSSRGTGSYVLTFNELENGIIRGNRKAPYALRRPFSNDDGRLSLILPQMDNRIHFALNCGATSCPPVKNFTAEGVSEELRVVARAFCEDDNNVKIDGNTRTLYLSKIFHWYSDDFGGSPVQAAEAVCGFIKGSIKAEKLRQLIDSGKMRIEFNKYDWTTDAGKCVAFTGYAVKADTSRLIKL